MITPVGTASFVKLAKPEANPSGDLKYSVSLLIDKSDKAALGVLDKAVEIAKQKGIEKKWSGKLPRFTYSPVRDGDEKYEENPDAYAAYKGKMYINCSCGGDSTPGIVDQYGQATMDRDIIYSGCKIRLDVRPYPYKSSGNSGVAWWLNNAMFVEDGDRLDGKLNAVDAFADYATTDSDDGDLA